jgi:hypothetical protein
VNRHSHSQFVLASSHLILTTSNISFSAEHLQCSNCRYVTSSLTRGWVYCLQLLLALASAVILKSESRGTRDFPSRRLLRLAGLRWRNSAPPPHGINEKGSPTQYYIVAYRPDVRQRPQDKQCNKCSVYSRCYAIGQ